jgi:hypothetical protein
VGEPKGGQAGRGVDLIAAPVARLLRRRPVITQSVGLDDQSKLGPEEVDADAVDHSAGLRQRQSSRPDESKETPLELGIGQAEGPAIEQAPERWNPALAGHLRERCSQSLRVNQIALVRLIDGSLECSLAENCGEIQQSCA